MMTTASSTEIPSLWLQVSAAPLPFVFLILMGVAVLAYVVLDGYDLGVGLLVPFTKPQEQDVLIASIGPFWDANETWLVLGIGLLLCAFPTAHGEILTALYLPVLFMLIGLILRGCAFDFRSKVPPDQKKHWTQAFFIGSLIAALSQGYMLGSWIMAFSTSTGALLFTICCSIGVAGGYALLGATWSSMKTTGTLQLWSFKVSRYALALCAFGVLLISVATPLASPYVFQKWFSTPNIYYLIPIPLCTALLFIYCYTLALRFEKNLKQRLDLLDSKIARDALSAGGEQDIEPLPQQNATHPLPHPNWPYPAQGSWRLFACAVGIFVLGFAGLAYSMFPYLVLEKLTIWQAANSKEALSILLFAALSIVPIILLYTGFSYWVFRGKAQLLDY